MSNGVQFNPATLPQRAAAQRLLKRRCDLAMTEN